MGDLFPNLHSPSWIEQRFAWFPQRMSDTKKLIWFKSYYVLCAYNPFVDMTEWLDTYEKSQSKKYLTPFKRAQDKWRTARY